MKQLGIKKLYYSISEVSKITDLEQYVLRYWESEFELLNPAKNRAGNRIYTNKDIKLILYIKRLLREQRYTIEGAKQILQSYIPEMELGGEQLELIGEGDPLAVEDAALAQMPQTAPASPPAPSARTSPSDPRLRNDMIEIKRFLEELLVRLT